MRRIVLLSLFLLAACVGQTPAPVPPPTTVLMPIPHLPPQECVPYARTVSGIEIYGDAKDWWRLAAGKYICSQTPAPGAVLVLRPDSRLPEGHVAVVRVVETPRRIIVAHANWGWNGKTRGVVQEAMPVADVSPANDWSQTRFWNPWDNVWGRVYPALGFIHPKGSP